MNLKIVISTLVLFSVLLGLSSCITIEDAPANCSAVPASAPIINATPQSIAPASNISESKSSDIPPGPIPKDEPADLDSPSKAPNAASVPSPTAASVPSKTPVSSPVRPDGSEDTESSDAPSKTSVISYSKKNGSQVVVKDPASLSPSVSSPSAAAPSASSTSKPKSASGQSTTNQASTQVSSKPASGAPEFPKQAPAGGVNADLGSIYVYPIRRTNEGGLVSFADLKAVDPDGQPVTYSYDPPLDANGVWQTRKGDAGTYYTNVSASDGKDTTVQMVIIAVGSLNKAPVIEGIDSSKPITINPGDTLRLEPKVTDPNGDPVDISFEGWKTNLPYKVTSADAGNHTITIVADDGTSKSYQDVKIVVRAINRAPVLKSVSNLSVMEGELVAIKPIVTDADDDLVSFQFSKPLSEDGTWATKPGDAGTYPITVSASDGKSGVKTMFTLTVKRANLAPVIQGADDMVVKEGQTIKLHVTAEDPEGKNVTITYSGYMTRPEKQVGYDDQGIHFVNVLASDGELSTKSIIKIDVQDTNRPPVFLPDVQARDTNQ